ncbi:MAG TPA: FKBP-type peptidyl-prolyl cis-trans isomerase [Candidatus Binatia bacterium]|nr:FKBP-type peptidyl-prolyl cis-trans isomerase [Candidatus Binatia bacterium]
MKRGIKLLAEHEGTGEPAKKNDRVVYNLRMFLNRGEEVPLNKRQADYLPTEMIRSVEDDRFVDHCTVLGSRETIAGVEYSLMGMKKDGYRKVRLSPHMAFRDEGLPGLVPANAVLVVELWLRDVISE